MGMSRAQKEVEIKALNQRFEEDELVVITHYSGLSVREMNDLRTRLRAQGASFKVTKNSLTKRALKGTKFEHLEAMFAGPTGVATSKDPVAAAKVAHDFSKDHEKLVILGGAMGEQPLGIKEIGQLAKLPSMDELRGTLVGLLQAPAGKLARVVQAPAGGLARVIGAYAAKSE